MAAQYLGTQAHGFSTQSLYRLSSPLLDCGPDSRVVVVVDCDAAGGPWVVLGNPWFTRGSAYEGADGVWKAIPAGHGSWVRCYGGLSARDEAFARAETAAAHGNWSA